MHGRKCFLIIRYEAHTYMGGLSFNNSDSCRQIFDFLKPQIGRSIKDIGDLDVPFT